jgi:hypothetical protein
MMKFINIPAIENLFCSNRLKSLFPSRGSGGETVAHREAIGKWISDTIATTADPGLGAQRNHDARYYDVKTLRELTDNLLESRRHVKPYDVDGLVKELIQAHSKKPIAIMATMHRASREVLIEHLQRELQGDSISLDGIATSLRLVVEAARANFATIDRAEIQWANALLSLSTASPQNVCGRLEAYSDVISTSAPEFLILNKSTATQIQYQVCQQFSLLVEEFLLECRFQEAYTACVWLSQLSPASTFTHILDDVCPYWRTWAAWRPNQARIQRWVTLNAEERKALSHVLCLEGPDSPVSTGSSLMTGVLSRLESNSEVICGSIVIKVPECEEPSRTLERILAVLDAMLEQDSRSFSVFTETFLGNTITTEQLRIFDATLATHDSSITLSVLQFIVNTKGHSAGGLLQLISALNKLNESGDQLRELVTPMILGAIPKYLEPLQAEFQDYAEKGMLLESVGMHLANRLYRLKDATWLVDRLDPNKRELLHRLARLDILQAALSLHDKLQQGSDRLTTGLVVMLKAYCREQLTDQDQSNEEERAFIDEMLRIWTTSRNHEIQKAALFLAKATHIPVDIRRTCLSSVTSVSEKLIEAVCEMENIERACFRITRALTPKSNNAARTVNGCWTDLLEALIHSQGADLALRMCSSLSVKQWFQWQEGLRELFLDGTGRQRLSTPLLQRSSLHWSERLCRDFSRELELVQEATKGPQIRCILLQQEDITVIGQLLRALKLINNNSKITRSVVVGILSNLRPDCRNTQAITDAMSRLTFMSATGLAVSEKLVELLACDRQQNVAEFLATIPQASALLESDMRALNCIGAVYR